VYNDDLFNPKFEDVPYPVTIVRVRYSGVYEGGQWSAFNMYDGELPQDAFDDDITCCEWWSDPENRKIVGVGGTPDKALAHLIELMK